MSASAVALVTDADGKLNRLVAAQLQKTKMCAMNQRGTCRDSKCRFAHSQSELRTAPNLTKTAICQMFTRGKCQNNSCKFAHGEQELRVTLSVYKTQLCNFHTRGHCKKGNRCRHAHGEDELRADSETSTAPPSPSTHEDTQSGEAESSPYHNAGHVDEMGLPCEPADMSMAQDPRALNSMAPAGYWSPTGMMGTNPEWWADMLSAGGVPANGAFTTPPTSHMMYSQPTPEKYGELVPPFPGMQLRGSDIAEPMKISLPPFLTMPGRETPEPLRNDATQTHEELNNMMNFHAQCAWAAQAKMDYELAAAQLRLQELQAKRQLYGAAQFAPASPVSPVVQSHFDNIMQTLQKLPSRPISPADVELPQTIRPAMPPGLDLALDSARAAVSGGGPLMESQQRGAAFVI